MTKRINLRVLAMCLLTAFVLSGVSLLNQNSFAQEQERKLVPGEKFEVGGGQSVEIIQCRGEGRDQECEVQYYRASGPEGKPMWQWASQLLAAEARVLAVKQPKEKAETGNQRTADNALRAKNDDDDADATPTVKAERPASKEDCSFAGIAGDTSKTAKPSEQLFKARIYYLYNLAANGTGSAPLKVGVTFLSFQMNKSFTNIVRVDPAFGAYRINDAAPPNATIYPVASKHIVCEQYRNSTMRRQVENKYACFKNRDGEWVCGADGIPKITQLN
ncbi:MAG: hypothetical protein ABJB61_06480 [bacterium]